MYILSYLSVRKRGAARRNHWIMGVCMANMGGSCLSSKQGNNERGCPGCEIVLEKQPAATGTSPLIHDIV